MHKSRENNRLFKKVTRKSYKKSQNSSLPNLQDIHLHVLQNQKPKTFCLLDGGREGSWGR